jgi:hypothetical protein
LEIGFDQHCVVSLFDVIGANKGFGNVAQSKGFQAVSENRNLTDALGMVEGPQAHRCTSASASAIQLVPVWVA